MRTEAIGRRSCGLHSSSARDMPNQGKQAESDHLTELRHDKCCQLWLVTRYRPPDVTLHGTYLMPSTLRLSRQMPRRTGDEIAKTCKRNASEDGIQPWRLNLAQLSDRSPSRQSRSACRFSPRRRLSAAALGRPNWPFCSFRFLGQICATLGRRILVSRSPGR